MKAMDLHLGLRLASSSIILFASLLSLLSPFREEQHTTHIGFTIFPDLEDLLRHDNDHRYPNSNQRKSCECCRFRKKRCSSRNTCVQCFRIGIDCVYMPDLITKVTNCFLEIASQSPSLGTRICTKFDASSPAATSPLLHFFRFG